MRHRLQLKLIWKQDDRDQRIMLCKTTQDNTTQQKMIASKEEQTDDNLRKEKLDNETAHISVVKTSEAIES